MDRRSFITGACATIIGAACLDPSESFAGKNDAKLKEFEKAVITGADGKPLKAADLKEGESFIFNYPYASSPAFLINTGSEVGANGDWKGGVGEKKSIVAFVAICTHALSYPSKNLSSIAYRHKAEGKYAKKDHMITCCSHGSVFDVDAGGKRIDGPAPAGLTAILLEHDPATDTLTASATYGIPKLHKKFLKRNKKKLRKIYGRKEYKQKVAGKTAPMKKMEEISENIAKC